MGLEKTLTGINGFDEITDGGLPKNRVSLISGNAGTGKTLFSLEFLVNGIKNQKENGIFISFEESENEIISNAQSIHFDLNALRQEGSLIVENINLDADHSEEVGDYDLSPLVLRIKALQKQNDAKRIVFDTLEILLSKFRDPFIIRNRVQQLFQQLKEMGLTILMTGERDDKGLSKRGFEAFSSDCVISLDHRVVNQLSTRRLRVVKYRGSAHSTNEFPFMIHEQGIIIYPITSMRLDYKVSNNKVSTGISGLDEMLGGQGFYEGTTVLISGTSGTGKTSIGASIINHACKMGHQAVFYSLEEASAQIARNMQSINIDLNQWIEKDLLHIYCSRSTNYGLEYHLLVLQKLLNTYKPKYFFLDAISNFINAGSPDQMKQILLRMIDLLKTEGVTTIMTSLANKDDGSGVDVSSFVDTWLFLDALEDAGERNRTIYIIKSRGMAHSNQAREFLITNQGIELVNLYTNAAGVHIGRKRTIEESLDRAKAAVLKSTNQNNLLVLENEKKIAELRIEQIKSELLAKEKKVGMDIMENEEMDAMMNKNISDLL